MSDSEARVKHSKRLYKDEVKIKKRAKTIKEMAAYFEGHSISKQPHRLHKITGMNCGNPDCLLCANPRKTLHERTLQEQSFRQEKLWSDE